MTSRSLLYTLFLAIGLLSCTDHDSDEDAGYVAPDPPVQIVQGNVFSVEFYSRLSDETLFSSGDYSQVISHISANKSPVAFLFDRSDMTVGQASPSAYIGWQAKLKSFFVQNGIGDTKIEGTGMIVRPLITEYTGIYRADTLFMSGCKLSLPCTQPVTVVISTCKIGQEFQYKIMPEVLGDSLKTNKILVGTIATDLKDSFSKYLKLSLKGFRLAFYTSQDSVSDKYVLFVLSPVNFVCRSIEKFSVGDLPMYNCKLEYLN